MLSPETDVYCKNCMGHQYCLSCTGREHCGIHADISGTIVSLREHCQKVWGKEAREQAAKALAEKETIKKQSAFDSAARAYNRGEGFIQMAPALGWAFFTYEGHDWNLDAIAERAYQLR